MPRQLVASPWLVPRERQAQLVSDGTYRRPYCGIGSLEPPHRCPAWKRARLLVCLGTANLAQAESRKIVRPCIVRISTAAMSGRVRELAPITVSSRLGNAFQVATCSALP
jgi:hypothetical protein